MQVEYKIEVFMMIVGSIALFSKSLQIMKLYKRKSSDDISIAERGLLCFCFLCWLFYGFYKKSISIIFANTFSILLIAIIIILCLKYKNKNTKGEE